jgi:hypothetical protein
VSRQELTAEELERQQEIDTAIFDLVNDLNPGEPLEWDIEDIGAIRDEIAALLVRKGCCTAHEFYPYLEINEEEDPDKPFLSHQGVDVWTCVDDDEMEASFHYSTSLDFCNIDNFDAFDHQFDVRDIPLAEGMTPAHTWKETRINQFHGSSSEETTGREAHAAIIRYAIEQGWLTQDGLNVPEDSDAAQN